MSENGIKYSIIRRGIERPSQALRAPNVSYRCELCGGMVPSMPADNVECRCGNIVIDIEYHRLYIKDYSRIQIVQVLD